MKPLRDRRQPRRTAGPQGYPPAPASTASAVADASVQALAAVRHRLLQVRSAADDDGEAHLKAALEAVDRLMRAIVAASPEDGHAPSSRSRPDGYTGSRPTIAVNVSTAGARAELPRLLDTAAALHERLRRITVALMLSEDTIADVLDGVEPPGPHNEATLAARSRASAAICRELTARLDAVRAGQADTASS